MVRPKVVEADLFALAEAAGKEGPRKEEGVPVGGLLQGSRGINQDGDDPGFETRVKPPTKSTNASAAKAGSEKQTSSKGPGRPRGTAQERTLQEVADGLEENFVILFSLLSNPLPVTGTYGVENSGKACAAILSIAKRRPLVMKALLVAADGSDGLQLLSFVAGLMFAVQVDLGRMPADSMGARVTGVTKIVEQYFLNDEPQDNPNVTEQVTNAPRFQPV